LGCKLQIIHLWKNRFRSKAILAAIIRRIPTSKGNVDEPLQALIFDSTPFRGIEVIFRVINGEIKEGSEEIKFMATGNEYFADEIGTLKLNQVRKSYFTGDGYLISGI
jgi:GTP-binding protein LepA